MSDAGRIVYDPTYGTGMQRPPKVTITPTDAMDYPAPVSNAWAVLYALRHPTLEAGDE